MFCCLGQNGWHERILGAFWKMGKTPPRPFNNEQDGFILPFGAVKDVIFLVSCYGGWRKEVEVKMLI